ncbi:MAG: hypothetical protein HY237_10110 [Acidobacteria bacterium]|nr:hypothetical protein [Acidobacteriota bacterium]
MRKIRLILLGAALCVFTPPLVAQQKVKVYVAEIKGPDQFISERFKLLFMEELSRIKTVELVNSKDDAQLILEGIGRLDTLQQAQVSGTASQTGAVISGSGGDAPNAMLSIKVSELKTGRILFVGNKSKVGGFRKGATHGAVSDVVKDIKKKLKWK